LEPTRTLCSHPTLVPPALTLPVSGITAADLFAALACLRETLSDAVVSAFQAAAVNDTKVDNSEVPGRQE